MKLAALAMVVVAGSVLGGIFLLSNGRSDKQLHPIEPISVSELSRRPVVGRLGHSLGEIVTIEGTVADGSFTRAKADEAEILLRVQIVNGQRIEDEQVFHFQLASGASISSSRVGSNFKYLGYETGGFTGIPGDAFQYIGMVATTRYGFTTTFLLVRDEKDRLKDPDKEVRGSSAAALAGIGARETIPALLEALKDKEPEVRRGVVEGLGGMKGAGGVVVPILVEALKDPADEVQWAVFTALGKLGLEAKAAVAELIRRAKDLKGPWRAEALKVLRQIAPQEAETALKSTPASVCSLRENRDPSPLPSPDKLESMKATYHDRREDKEVTFAVPKKHWEKIWKTLLPATRDNEPAKWEVIGRLELKLKSGGQFIVELYATEKVPGAFAAGETFERRAYFRGGNSKQLQAALRSAYLDSRRKD